MGRADAHQIISVLPVQIGIWFLVSPGLHSVTHVYTHAKCGPGPDWIWRVSLLDGEIQLDGCLREQEGTPQE